MMAPTPDLYALRERVGGVVSRNGQTWQGPGPGHSRRDQSLKVDIADDGRVLVHSFVGDTLGACEDHLGFRVRRERQDAAPKPSRSPTLSRPGGQADAERTAYALALWQRAVHPRGTPVGRYFDRRGLDLPPEAAGEALRWHADCPFGKGQRASCMVALVRDIATNRPIAIHRTALTASGEKAIVGGVSRLSLGPIDGGAIKLAPDAHVETCLGIGEGLESALSLRRLAGCEALPVWSLIAAGQLAKLPVLAGVDGLWIAVDNDPTGLAAAAAVRDRWHAAGVEVLTATPRAEGADLNDLARLPHAA